MFDGVVADTVFSVKRGFYDTPQSVVITCTTPGAEIRYTHDVSTPSATAGTVVVSGPASGANSAANDLGVWTHLAIVWDGAAWRLYRNGTQIASAASAVGAVVVPNVGWAIGARGTGSERFFGGQIDEVRIYNRGLTPAEITALFNNTATTGTATWAQPGTDDSSWAPASGAPGFAPPGDALAPAITQDISSGMFGVNSSAYVRLPFSLTEQERNATSLLRLRIKADDGYVAYLNGTRIASRNAPPVITGTSSATAETPDTDALAGETVDLASAIPLLSTGTNVLAIQPLNLAAADDDLLISAELDSSRGIPGIAPGATVYSGAVPLAKSTIARARTYNPATQQWSGLQEIFYQVGPYACPPGALAVTELHFNPAGDDDAEFIEIANVSDAAVNLRGASFTAGIQFAFPANRDTLLGPGQRLVLVDSQYTFQEIHGWPAPVAGIYGGQLSNSGERITLTAANGTTTLLDFEYLNPLTYGGVLSWPPAADGGGHSLILINPAPGVDHSNPANWRVSTSMDGNPNTADALLFSGNPDADVDGDGLRAFAEFGLGTSDLVPNVLPVAYGFDPVAGFLVTLDHANAADAAHLAAQASTDMLDWNVPVQLFRRDLLPDGRLRTTWRAAFPAQQMFFRFQTP